MKKYVCAFLAVLFLFGATVTVSAAGGGSLSVSAATMQADGSLAVELHLSGNPGIIAAGIDISYDSSKLAMKSVENGNVFSRIYIKSETLSTKPYRVMWADITATQNITANGKLATLIFTPRKTAASTTVEVQTLENNCFNAELQNVFINGCAFQLKYGDQKSSSSGGVSVSPVQVVNSKPLPPKSSSQSGTSAQSSNKTGGSTATASKNSSVVSGVANGAASEQAADSSENHLTAEQIESLEQAAIQSHQNREKAKTRKKIIFGAVAVVLAGGAATGIVLLRKRRKKS